MTKRLRIISSKGGKYLLDCPSADDAAKVLATAARSGIGDVTANPEARVEFGYDTPKRFVVESVIREGKSGNPQ